MGRGTRASGLGKSRERREENGEWRVENGEWRMENGEWRMENGNLAASPVAYRRAPIVELSNCSLLN
jgi:hypothetical protein